MGRTALKGRKTIRFGWLSPFLMPLECGRIVLIAAVLLIFILVMTVLSILVLILGIRIILIALGIVKIPAVLVIPVLRILLVVLRTLGILAAAGIVGILGIIEIPAVLCILIVLILLVVIQFLILRHSMVTSFPFAVSMSGAAGNILCFLHTKFCLSVNQRLSSAAEFDIIRC